jgi:uncharacterized protein YodC (DUF2158 family)
MPAFASGDLVVLKSGGPVMTIDTVNTDIFDDSKITGVLCVWFVGDRLERVRFDHRAIDPVDPPAIPPPDVVREDITASAQLPVSEDSPGEYNTVMDNMMGALNTVSDQPPPSRPPPRRRKAARVATASENTRELNT